MATWNQAKNQRQLQLMLIYLEDYSAGKVPLWTLVDQLDGLLNALEEIPSDWKTKFEDNWLHLEIANAVSIDAEVTEVLPSHLEAVNEAIKELKNLVSSYISNETSEEEQ